MLPQNKNRVAGVVLAGGRSSRMGQNKALLDYKGQPLIDFMCGLLHKTGLSDIYISGDLPGYDTIKDPRPYEGPAAAIRYVMDDLSGYKGALFVPVDMPFLNPDLLRSLCEHKSGAYYKGRPLPVYLPAGSALGEGASVKQMLAPLNAAVLAAPEAARHMFSNLNTPQEWEEAVNQ